MAITTAMCTSFKQELLQGGHCFNATLTPTATAATTTAVTAVSGGTGAIAVGMAVTGTSVAAGTVVTAITGASAFTMYPASTGSISAGTITIAGDVFKMALIRAASTATYSLTNANYTDVLTLNTDEVSGTGYTAAGTTLVNVTPTVNTTQAITNFSPNPSWVTASFSTIGCMIYNSSDRLGGVSGTNSSGAGRACGVFDFGGTQTVTAGTFTVVMPGASSGSAILRIA